jgi:hypothetical protein
LFLFRKNDDGKERWKLEYFDTIYKVYDWDKNLTGYFFPNYQINDKEPGEMQTDDYDFDEEMKIIDKMNKEKQKIFGGNLMLPLIKLSLLDNEEGIDIDYVIKDLENNLQKTHQWKQWLYQNEDKFNLKNTSIFNSREDRNMLSIVLAINLPMILGETGLLYCLKPILDKLHEDGLI